MHDFGAFKSAAFEVQEMGESGEGSLEPGVASGEKFFVAYQQPYSSSISTRRTWTVCRTATLTDKPIVELVLAPTAAAGTGCAAGGRSKRRSWLRRAKPERA